MFSIIFIAKETSRQLQKQNSYERSEGHCCRRKESGRNVRQSISLTGRDTGWREAQSRDPINTNTQGQTNLLRPLRRVQQAFGRYFRPKPIPRGPSELTFQYRMGTSGEARPNPRGRMASTREARHQNQEEHDEQNPNFQVSKGAQTLPCLQHQRGLGDTDRCLANIQDRNEEAFANRRRPRLTLGSSRGHRNHRWNPPTRQ